MTKEYFEGQDEKLQDMRNFNIWLWGSLWGTNERETCKRLGYIKSKDKKKGKSLKKK